MPSALTSNSQFDTETTTKHLLKTAAVELANTGTAHIHRAFFRSAIGVVLTLGAVWGAILLLRIAFFGSFTSVGVHEVNAHGHAQIFGWVGLFVMGFAYQMIPRFKNTTLAFRRLVPVTLGLMLSGIVLRSGFEPFVKSWPQAVVPAVAGGLMEIIAIGLFAASIVVTIRRSIHRIQPSDCFIAGALVWFVVQSIYTTVYFVATAGAVEQDALLKLISTWQAPLRDIQIHGFALLMIFGISQRIFPMFYGIRSISARASQRLFWLLTLGVSAEVTGLIMMRLHGYRWAGLWQLGALALVVGCFVFAFKLGVFHRMKESDRSTKFFRAAYAWLLLSMTMLAILPLWQFVVLPVIAPASHAVEIGFSHAYYGAIRHAITVGFVSLMIMGVALRVVPQWAGWTSSLTQAWIPFALVNTGCAMRVTFQTLTDASHTAFPIAGVSGILEVTGLAIWGFHLLHVMSRRNALQSDAARFAN